MTLWYTFLYIADLLLYYSCMVESKQSFLPERHFNPQPCYFTQSYRCLFQLPKFKSPLGKGKKQEYSERRLLGYFIFKLFLWFKGTLTEFELNILNFIFLFFMYRMILTSIYNASSKFKSQILSYKQETKFEILCFVVITYMWCIGITLNQMLLFADYIVKEHIESVYLCHE